MTHDDLCPVDKSQSEAIALNGKWIDPSGVVCICERLQRVREDERAECIAAVAALPAKAQHDDGFLSLCFDKGEALAALRARGAGHE